MINIIKRILLALLIVLTIAPTAVAYNPPPATLIALLLRPQIRIQLPPKLIMTPDKLTFPQAGLVYDFNAQGQFVRTQGGGFDNYRIRTSTTNAGDGTAYIISITGFKKDEAPTTKDFRLTFKSTVTKENIDNLERYLKNNTAPPTAQLTGPGCEGGNGADSHICLKTITTVTGSSTRLGDAVLKQTIPLRGVTIEGNVAAPNGALERFSVSAKALAVGNSVLNVGGQTIAGYDVTRSKINWPAVGSQLNSIFDRRDSVPSINLGNNSYNNAVWELNSKSNNPADGAKDSFSTPPEGKLWNVQVNGQNFFTIGDGNNSTIFKGAGTIVFSRQNGQGVDLEFREPISCPSGTRLAFLTKGDITFHTPPDGILQIDCGAYISLGGKIIFEDNQPPVVGSGDVTGIFVAKDSITLPEPNNLLGIFSLKRDNFLATNPTVLFKELLKLVFTTSG